MNIDDYLTLDWRALNALPAPERFRVLGEIAHHSGTWVRDQRGQLLDELRTQGLSDTALAEQLGVSKQAVGAMGDGYALPNGVKPTLLRRVAATIEERLDPSQHVYSKAIREARGLLSRKHLSYKDWWSVAHRIRHAARGMRADDLRSMSYTDRRAYQRGLAHAVEVAERTQSRFREDDESKG